MTRICTSILALGLWAAVGNLVVASIDDYSFFDQTPTSPIIAGDYQRYVSLLGNGADLSLWYENRTTGNIDVRTSTSGYTGFGGPTATTGLTGLAHPRIFSDGAGGYVGFFQNASLAPPNGIQRMTSLNGVDWSGALQIVIDDSANTSNLWGVAGYFENVSGSTDVLYYTQGTGAVEDLYRATATDGQHFTNQGVAFVNPGPVGTTGFGVSVGSQVLYDPILQQYLLLWAGESTVVNIGYATSADGVTFAQQGSAILNSAGHSDLQEVSFVLNGTSMVGVYTGDFNSSSNNHIGAFTGTVNAEPGALFIWSGLGAVGLALAWRRRKQVASTG